MIINKADFGEDFKWGVSTAAYQIEGAHNKDDKGTSIWDTFTLGKKNILNGDHGNIACDFYHKYVSDIQLMKQLHIDNFRLSISWSRIFPHQTGVINQKGIAYYNRVIDLCLEMGIQPWVTLYHWDLPDYLQQKGGWTNRDIIQWFSEYVTICAKQFGDRITNWMVLNEPLVFTGAGYFFGIHAPGKKGFPNFFSAAHHAAICQAEGARIIKSLFPHSKVGTTFSYSHIDPASEKERDLKAAKKVDTILNRFFLEPLLGKPYPIHDLPLLSGIEKYMKQGDDQLLAFDMDFIGLQNYTREIVKYSPFNPFLQAKLVNVEKRNGFHTAMNWEVHPPSIYKALHRLNDYKEIKEIIVTENGAAFEDEVVNDAVDDFHRKDYLQKYIEQVFRAKLEGVKVKGYFVWTLLDNFEWAKGFHPRFGLVHVDFHTQKRIIKSSGHWYGEFLMNKKSLIES